MERDISPGNLIGLRLKMLRLSRGLSREEVAKSVGISEQMLCRMEKGDTEQSIDNVAKLAVLYGVTLDFIILGIAEDSDLTDQNKNIMDLLFRNPIKTDEEKAREKKESYVLSVSLMKGCYRHIRVSANATLYALHRDIIELFKIEDNNEYVFFMNNKAWDERYGYYSEYVCDARQFSIGAKLKDFNLQKDSKFLYILNFENEIRFKIKVLSVIKEDIERTELIKSVG